jgi:hypothetical protein
LGQAVKDIINRVRLAVNILKAAIADFKTSGGFVRSPDIKEHSSGIINLFGVFGLNRLSALTEPLSCFSSILTRKWT